MNIIDAAAITAIIAAIIIVTAVICLLVGYLATQRRLVFLENSGEAAVRRTLMANFPTQDYHLLNNVTLPMDDGTTQIDHILVSRYGIFVLETKHYSGWLFADANSPQWTQVIYRMRFRFQNPLHQNHKHALAVAKLLDFVPSEKIYPIVVFTGDAIFKTPCPDGVFALEELPSTIHRFKDEVLSQNRLQFCVGRLECCRKAITRQTDVEHIAYLNRKYGGVD